MAPEASDRSHTRPRRDQAATGLQPLATARTPRLWWILPIFLLVLACGGVGSLGPGPISQISVVPDSVSLAVGDSVRLVLGADAGSVHWSSTSTDVASVDQTGLVKAVSPGISIITAASTTDANKAGSAKIVVPGP